MLNSWPADEDRPTVLPRRSPAERARQYAEERSRLRREGLPTESVDFAEQVGRDLDVERVQALVRQAVKIVGSWSVEYRQEVFELPAFVTHRLLVELVIGFLYERGLVREWREPVGWDHRLTWRDVVSEHLRPDVAGEWVRHEEIRQMRERVRREAPDRDWSSLNPERPQWRSDRKDAGSGDG